MIPRRITHNIFANVCELKEDHMLSDDLLVGAQAIAGYLGMERHQIYYMVAQKRLPVIKKGSLIFARKSELDRAFAAEAA